MPRKPKRRTVAADIPADSRAAIITAACALASERDWRHVGLADIAERAKMTLAELYRAFPGKSAIVTAFMRGIDAAVLATPVEADDTPRDRLFEVVMRRLDALRPHKAAVLSFVRATCLDPAAAAAVGPQFLCSAAWMIEAARIPAHGLVGLLRVAGFAALWANALRVWRDDDSPDLAKTMAALDKGLRQGEWLFSVLGVPGRGAGGDTAN